MVEIARALNRRLGGRESLQLEVPFGVLLENVTRGPGAPLQSIKPGNKADIALFNGVRPTCIIEVKTNPSPKGIMHDLGRLRDVVYTCRNEPRVLNRGFLAIGLSSDDTESKIDSINEFFKDKPDRARAKRPSAKTWGDQASIVVEVTAAKIGWRRDANEQLGLPHRAPPSSQMSSRSSDQKRAPSGAGWREDRPSANSAAHSGGAAMPRSRGGGRPPREDVAAVQSPLRVVCSGE